MVRPSGTVFSYPYLWKIEEEAGLKDAKDRTACMAIRKDVTQPDGGTVSHLLILGITDQVWEGQRAVEITEMEKRRAGLNPSREAYVIVTEYNYDVLPHSWHYAPSSPTYGALSAGFMKGVEEAMKALSANDKLVRIDRTQSGAD